MGAQILALAVMVPFIGVFIYAGVHEYRRYKTEGTADYGLVYDEDTGTTYVGAIPEGEEIFDLDEFDPNNWNEPDSKSETDAETTKA